MSRTVKFGIGLMHMVAIAAVTSVCAAQPVSAQATPATSATPEAQPQAAGTSRVVSLFAKAQAAYAQGDQEAALRAYSEAWELQKSFDIAGNLGGVELKLKHYVDAAEHLRYALETFPPSGKPAQRTLLEQHMGEALQECGRLRVLVQKGATVRVSGFGDVRTVGVAPLREFYVTPGSVQVDAELYGFIGGKRSITVGKGGEATVTLTLLPVAEPWRPGVGLIVAGSVLSVAAIATGGGLVVAMGHKATDVNNDQKSVSGNPSGCYTSASAPCLQLAGDLKQYNMLYDANRWMFAVGGALTAATVVLGSWRAAATVVQVQPAVGFGGVSFLGKW